MLRRDRTGGTLMASAVDGKGRRGDMTGGHKMKPDLTIMLASPRRFPAGVAYFRALAD